MLERIKKKAIKRSEKSKDQAMATKKKAAKKKTSAATANKAVSKKTVSAKKKIVKANASGTQAHQLEDFIPYQTKKNEEYMSEKMKDHFRNLLRRWRSELMQEVDRTVDHMKDDANNYADPNDRATQESEFGLELRTRDRDRKLLNKIQKGLQRIDEGEYGFCEETGEEIGLKRLHARPVATLSLEAQERRELAERQYRNRNTGYR